MTLSDPSVNAVLAAAQDKIRATADAAVVEVANGLLVLMKSAGTYRERGQLAFAQIHILESRELFLSSFATALRERIAEDVAARSENRSTGETDWQSISLVDEGQIEEKISFERIGQLIAHRSEAELRELDGYMSSLLRHGWADPSKNPLRGAVLGSALHKAIEKVTDEPETQKIFGRELGQAMANAMPACYLEIVAALKQRGLKPTDLAMRPADEFSARPPGRAGAGSAFEEARKAWEVSWQGRLGADPGASARSWENSIVGRFANDEPLPDGVDPESSAQLLDRLIRGGMPGSLGVPGGTRTPAAAEADAELMNLLRRLNGGATYQGEFDALPRDTGYGSYTGHGIDDFAPTTRSGVPLGVSYTQPPSSGLTGLMAANLIRAHRAELLQASRGKLDHLVIEVVSSLFDQILSDARVPPQMARQIARLQLPVLRAALTDGSFFSSRRHPVRRFINRIASLACAFDSFDSGPAKELLERVSGLVKEIVDGDFDQLDLYDAKLLELERFVAEQTHAEIRESAAAATLRGKELEWRVQQRFSQQLRAALEPLALPAFLRDFIAGVWGQAIVMASRRDGADAPYPARLRRAGADLVTSIQPKRSLDERKQFVAGLPALMAELTRGMKFVDWPQAAQDDFFGQLVTQHAGSLKGAARSELDHNMMVRHLEAAFRTPLPSAEEAAAAGRARAGARGGGAARAAFFARGRARDRPGLGEPGRLVARRHAGAAVDRARSDASVGSARRSAVRRCRRRRRRAVADALRRPDRPARRRRGRGQGRAARIARARARTAAARPPPARLFLPAQPEGPVAEGPPHVHEPGAQPLPLLARRQGPRDDLDDGANARPPVRGGAHARLRERVPDRPGDAARAPAARDGRSSRGLSVAFSSSAAPAASATASATGRALRRSAC